VSAWHQYTRGLEGQPPETFGEGDEARDMPWVSFQVYVPSPKTRSSSSSRQGDLKTKTFEICHSGEARAENRLDVYGIDVPEAETGNLVLDDLARRVARDRELPNLIPPPAEQRSARETEADQKELSHSGMLRYCVAHQRAKVAAAKAAGHRGFQMGLVPKGGYEVLPRRRDRPIEGT
jgi:hypothetical protein